MGIGHVDVAVVRVDRQPVIFRLPVFEERARRELFGSYGHAPDILVDPVQRVARAVELHFRGCIPLSETELLFQAERGGVDAVQCRNIISVGAAFVTAVGDRPQLVVGIQYQRCGLYADDQFVHHPVGSGVDLQQPVLVRPAVHVDVLPVLYHLLGRSRSGCHAGTLDVARDLVPPGVDDENAVVPKLGHIGLFVGDEVDVPRRGEVRDAAHLLECTEVDCEDDHANCSQRSIPDRCGWSSTVPRRPASWRWHGRKPRSRPFSLPGRNRRAWRCRTGNFPRW